jgi:hypothetical protein
MIASTYLLTYSYVFTNRTLYKLFVIFMKNNVPTKK